MAISTTEIALLDQKKRETVMRSGQIRTQLERPAVGTNGVVHPSRFRICNGHVLQHDVIVGPVAQRKTVRRERSVVVTLTFERQRFAEVVEALRANFVIGLSSEEPTQPGHACRNEFENDASSGVPQLRSRES